MLPSGCKDKHSKLFPMEVDPYCLGWCSKGVALLLFAQYFASEFSEQINLHDLISFPRKFVLQLWCSTFKMGAIDLFLNVYEMNPLSTLITREALLLT